MDNIFLAHRIIGSMVLPLLLLLAAIWFTVTWKPTAWPALPARFFRVLIGIQFLLGLSFWLLLIAAGAGARYLAFPFLFHPIAGLMATVVAQSLMRPNAFSTRLGRWTPLVSFGSILVLVVIAVVIANNV